MTTTPLPRMREALWLTTQALVIRRDEGQQAFEDYLDAECGDDDELMMTVAATLMAVAPPHLKPDAADARQEGLGGDR